MCMLQLVCCSFMLEACSCTYLSGLMCCTCISETAHAIFHAMSALQLFTHFQGMIMACLMCSCSRIVPNSFQVKCLHNAVHDQCLINAHWN